MSLFLVVRSTKDCDYYAMLKKGFGMGGIAARTLPGHSENDFLIPDSATTLEERWMSLALLEAMNGIGWAAPNPSVGCVIVKDNQVLARGFTQKYGGFHAERMAFESLQKSYSLDDLSNLHVYVTLEPCSHIGKQPPCAELLLHPAIEKVLIGCEDPNRLVAGKGIDLLKKAKKEVIIGVLKNEVKAWHYPFLNFQTHHSPIWVAKWAENQDGLLADFEGNSKWITNTSSRAYTHWLRQKYDAILVGAGTWIKDQPKLTVRDCAEPHRRNPIVLIHDPKDQIPKTSIPQSTYIYKQKTIEELISAVEKTDFGTEIQSIFCEGGARTLSELFRVNRIDIVHRFTGDKDFGVLSQSSPYRVTGFFEANREEWERTTLCEFGNDLLQEWVKCS